MYLLHPKEIRKLDAESPKHGVPTWTLMQKAGEGAFQFLRQRILLTPEKKALVLCGKGNNGGDGFVVASHLCQVLPTTVLFLGKAAQLKGDAKKAYQLYRRRGGKVLLFEGRLPKPSAFLLIDALLGTGTHGKLKSPYREAMLWINKARKQGSEVVALDIPTGVNGATGEVVDEAVRADYTATFGFAKIGLFLYPGRGFAGEIKVIDIGYPSAIRSRSFPVQRVCKEQIVSKLRKRYPFSHKGSYGKLMIIGGQRGMTGAIVLAGRAAYRSGCGLVYAAVPDRCLDTVDSQLTEAVVLPTEKQAWQAQLSKQTALVCGCGFGVGKEQKVVLSSLLNHSQPLLVDADGLNNLAQMRKCKRQNQSLILTPHPAEASRLLKEDVATLLADSVQAVRNLALHWKAIAIFKTYPVLVSDGAKVYLLDRGNPGMATGGMGDVLSGITGAFLAQGYDPLFAAIASVFILQRAGDIAKIERGEYGLLASDVVAALPTTFRRLGY